MRCLYCGKELALLKRLTGGGEFCSEAHKQSYQEEYNRLALSRLLQAQKKGQQASNSPSQSPSPSSKASVALEEPEPVAPVDNEVTQDSEAPVLEVALTQARTNGEASPEVGLDEATEEGPIDSFAVEESSLGDVAGIDVTEAEPESEPEPVDTAGFFHESPASVALADEPPHLESWQEPPGGPAMSEWLFENATFSLSTADLVSLDLRTKGSSIEDRAFSNATSFETQAGGQSQPALLEANPKPAKSPSRLPANDVTAIDLAPSSSVQTADESLVVGIPYEIGSALFNDSQLLELASAGIDFPSEDSDVVVLAASRSTSDGVAAPETEPAIPAPDAGGGEDDGPRASLEALSRLHQELVEHETRENQEPSSEPQAEFIKQAQVQTVEPQSGESAPETPQDQNEAAGPERVEIVAEGSKPADAAPEPNSQPTSQPTPGPAEDQVQPASETLDSIDVPVAEAEAAKSKFTAELFEISLKMFPPVKPALVGGQALASQLDPLLPQLKGLPLRPKVALATGHQPPSAAGSPSATAEQTIANKPATPAVSVARTPGASKPASSGQPTARLVQRKPPVPTAKPAQHSAAQASESRTPPSQKPVSSKVDGTKPQAKAVASHPKTVAPHASAQEAGAAKDKLTEGTPQTTPADRGPGSKATATVEAAASVNNSAKPKAEGGRPAGDKAKTADTGRPTAERTKPATDEAKKDVPTFGIAQPANGSLFSSLKVKLGLAIALVVTAGAFFLGWGGGKPARPAGSSPRTA